MTQVDKKVVNVTSSIVIKKSPDCREVTPKAIAGLSEAKAIERNTVGSFREQREDEDDDESPRT